MEQEEDGKIKIIKYMYQLPTMTVAMMYSRHVFIKFLKRKQFQLPALASLLQ